MYFKTPEYDPPYPTFGSACSVELADQTHTNLGFQYLPKSQFDYHCDTQKASSGSPVLDASNQVIGLHHLGLCPISYNSATTMRDIVPKILADLENNNCDAHCDGPAITGPEFGQVYRNAIEVIWTGRFYALTSTVYSGGSPSILYLSKFDRLGNKIGADIRLNDHDTGLSADWRNSSLAWNCVGPRPGDLVAPLCRPRRPSGSPAPPCVSTELILRLA